METSPSVENTRTAKVRAQRGNTCYNCRRRRIKCDGSQPSCTNCVRGGSQFEDCEYPIQGCASQASILEDMIASVKNRIRVLEDPNQADRIALHHPYDSNETLVDLGSLGSGASYPSESVTVADPQTSRSEWDALFRLITSNPHRIGFFLPPERLQQQLVLGNPLETGREDLTPALREVMSLWNIRLSRPQLEVELSYLRTSLDQLSEELALPGRNIIQLIQVEVMLGYYFLHDGKLVQALHHVDSALSMTLAAGISQPRASFQVSGSREALEEMHGFWSVVTLSSLCATVSGISSTVTPLPITDIGTQATGSMHAPITGSLQEDELSRNTPAPPYTMATVILEQVSTVPKHAASPYPLPWSEVVKLERLLHAVTQQLLAVDLPPHSHHPQSIDRKADITQLIVHAAMIRLHLPYSQELEQSRTHCSTAAIAIANSILVLEADLCKGGTTEPALGAICPAACEALARDVRSGRREVDHSKSVSALVTIHNVWNRLSSRSQYLASCLSKCEQKLGVRFHDLLTGGEQ